MKKIIIIVMVAILSAAATVPFLSEKPSTRGFGSKSDGELNTEFNHTFIDGKAYFTSKSTFTWYNMPKERLRDFIGLYIGGAGLVDNYVESYSTMKYKTAKGTVGEITKTIEDRDIRDNGIIYFWDLPKSELESLTFYTYAFFEVDPLTHIRMTVQYTHLKSYFLFMPSVQIRLEPMNFYYKSVFRCRADGYSDDSTLTYLRKPA